MPQNYSPIRWAKVWEGRAVVMAIENSHVMKKMFELYKDRKSIDDALSLKENALILFPNETEYSKKRKRDEPNMDALLKTKQYIREFRRWLENKSIVLRAVKNQYGEWLFYNMQRLAEFREPEKHMDRVIEGIIYNKNKDKDILKKGRKTRSKLTKQSEQEFYIDRNEKLRKKLERERSKKQKPKQQQQERKEQQQQQEKDEGGGENQ